LYIIENTNPGSGTFMKQFIFSLVALSLIHTGFSQKLFVWCPNVQEIEPRRGYSNEDTINLAISDDRIIPADSRVKCKGGDILSSLAGVFKKAYPSAVIEVIDTKGPFSDSIPNRITIKIAISAYQASFMIPNDAGTKLIPMGQWTGITEYLVMIYDNRQGKRGKTDTSISKISSKPNLWGYKTARNCLNTSFMQANEELLSLIDSLRKAN
jgi:hypothetical protein